MQTTSFVTVLFWASVISFGLVTTVDCSESRGVLGPAVDGPKEKPMVMRELTAEEARVIVEKGTERPFSGRFYKHKANGTYTCRRCGGELFASDAKFDSGCGWPSFDEALPGAVEEVPDADGRRTEIICARCGGHLGHVFRGEGLTPKDTRHCVNSISLDFADAESVPPETAYFAGGCFWGVEYYLEQIPGVVDVVSGYMGGTTDTPSYEEVCSGETGHAEVVKVTYDAARSDFETVARLFFEIHDPTQVNRQGPDIGHQYRSAVFTVNDEQQRVARKLVSLLEGKGLKVATEIAPAATFYPAEGYHQNYYERTGKAPYCHTRVKRF